jgi:hypothetical protein
MKYNYVRLTLSESEKDFILSILDEKLGAFNFSDPEFSQIFRVRDRLANLKVYTMNQKNRTIPEANHD